MMIMESDGETLTGLRFEDAEEESREPVTGPADETTREVFVQTSLWLDIYFRGQDPDFLPPMSINATDFRRRVWEILLSIPYGRTMTYGQIARKIASERGIDRMSAQAVGNAVGHNPVALIIPCHRVIGSDGSLTGYAGGIDRKRSLLEMEQSNKMRLL